MATSPSEEVKAPQHFKTPRAHERHRALRLGVVLLEEVVHDEFQFVDVLHLLIDSRVRVRVDEIAVEQPLRADDVGPVWSETVTMPSRRWRQRDAVSRRRYRRDFEKFKFIFHAESAPLHAKF